MLLTYILGCLALIAKPGPDLMCLIATAMADGKKGAAALMSGQILGCWLWIVLLAAGFAPLFADHPNVTMVVQALGVGYIGYLTLCTFREARADWRRADAPALPVTGVKGARLMGRGVAMAMSNPLTILFFLAFLPNFTRAESALPPSLQTLLLGTLFCLLIPLIDVPLILVAGFLRTHLFASPKALAKLKFASAAILGGVVAILLVSLLSALGGL